MKRFIEFFKNDKDMSDTNEKVKKDQETQDEPEELDTAEGKQSADKEESKYADWQREELIEKLEEQDLLIEELQKEMETAKENHLRKAAELENVRKRFKRERTQLFETARAKALEDFLPINDDLHRTLKAFEESEVNENFMDGVELVASKFEEVLHKYDVERIDEEMVPFDVDLHDAMMRQKPEDDSIDSDMVLKVVENGYRMGDRTIRHAKVIVSE
ncbi:nucleotide exchange factor GrpE [Halalkalibaculum sp. DA3122]|uniref:nucleotide exchange factor GrpE n=1 Tax=unclassified Halalkalibaculum TaxID=2964617 RepID=UPI0037543618